jgi:hypothetical protein
VVLVQHFTSTNDIGLLEGNQLELLLLHGPEKSNAAAAPTRP